MRTRRHSEDVASESYTARVDDANGTITREKKHLTQICVHKIGGSTEALRDAKVPIIDDRKLIRIALIKTNLRSLRPLIPGSFRAV